jgi:hypothetical protein
MSPGPEMQWYMAEVRLQAEAGTDLSWVGQSLDAACRRLRGGVGPGPQILTTVHVPDDGRLSCIVKATSRDDVLHLFEISLLPSARVVDVVVVEAGSSEIEPG